MCDQGELWKGCLLTWLRSGEEVTFPDKMSVYRYLAEDSCTGCDKSKGEKRARREEEEVYSRRVCGKVGAIAGSAFPQYSAGTVLMCRQAPWKR